MLCEAECCISAGLTRTESQGTLIHLYCFGPSLLLSIAMPQIDHYWLPTCCSSKRSGAEKASALAWPVRSTGWSCEQVHDYTRLSGQLYRWEDRRRCILPDDVVFCKTKFPSTLCGKCYPLYEIVDWPLDQVTGRSRKHSLKHVSCTELVGHVTTHGLVSISVGA